MAVIFFTSNAKTLLESFKQRINQKEAEGRITTWVEDSDGDFTHKAADWANKAWFRPVVSSDRLTFTIFKNTDPEMSVAVYGYYHGHVIETFLNHFDTQFSSGSATAQPTADDIVAD